MSLIHDPNCPRHARLFELLRQEHRAETTAHRGKGFIVRKVSAEEAQAIKARAERSLHQA